MNFDHVKTDKHTAYIPIIGYPMDHSSASFVYNFLFGRYGINAIMWPMEIEKGGLHRFMAAREVMKIDRFTLTMPHKADIIALLDDVDPCARLFQSVNVVYDRNGRSFGLSSDGLGLVYALRAAGAALEGRRVMMIGAGAISGIIGYELSRAGVREMSILNRTEERAHAIAGILNAHTSMLVEALPMTPDALRDEAERADILLQCSALGLHGYGADFDDLSFLARLPRHAIVMDAIVNPPETRLIAEARRLKHEAVYGMDMLVGQMRVIFEHWFGVTITHGEQEAAKAILLKRYGVK